MPSQLATSIRSRTRRRRLGSRGRVASRRTRCAPIATRRPRARSRSSVGDAICDRGTTSESLTGARWLDAERDRAPGRRIRGSSVAPDIAAGWIAGRQRVVDQQHQLHRRSRIATDTQLHVRVWRREQPAIALHQPRRSLPSWLDHRRLPDPRQSRRRPAPTRDRRPTPFDRRSRAAYITKGRGTTPAPLPSNGTDFCVSTKLDQLTSSCLRAPTWITDPCRFSMCRDRVVRVADPDVAFLVELDLTRVGHARGHAVLGEGLGLGVEADHASRCRSRSPRSRRSSGARSGRTASSSGRGAACRPSTPRSSR